MKRFTPVVKLVEENKGELVYYGDAIYELALLKHENKQALASLSDDLASLRIENKRYKETLKELCLQKDYQDKDYDAIKVHNQRLAKENNDLALELENFQSSRLEINLAQAKELNIRVSQLEDTMAALIPKKGE